MKKETGGGGRSSPTQDESVRAVIASRENVQSALTATLAVEMYREKEVVAVAATMLWKIHLGIF